MLRAGLAPGLRRSGSASWLPCLPARGGARHVPWAAAGVSQWSSQHGLPGLPAGRALAVDLLDCFLSKVLGEASIRQISFRKYVDDLVLYSTGQQCGSTLLHAFKEVRSAMTNAGMVLNAKKTKVVVNGRVARQSVKRSWRGRSLPALESRSSRCAISAWMCSGPRDVTQ
eukprot:2771639-Amphidinium_carterae.2